MRSVLLGILCVAVPATTAFAHGGYYQGPKTSDGLPLPTTGPNRGGIPTTGEITRLVRAETRPPAPGTARRTL